MFINPNINLALFTSYIILIFIKHAMMDILVPIVYFDVAFRAMGGDVNKYAIVQKSSAIVQLDVKVV